MDEATSALDNKTEEEIVDQIRRLKGQITMIIIAHRHSTVEHCDKIYRLEQGKIVQEGSPQNVLTDFHLQKISCYFCHSHSLVERSGSFRDSQFLKIY